MTESMSADNVGKIQRIAQHLADRVKDDKRPYANLKWIAENCAAWQYGIEQSEAWEAYFAALNILKQAGVQNPSRAPLTNLSKKERQQFRRWAKEFAALLHTVLNLPVEVSRNPVKNFSDGQPHIMIEVKFGLRLCATSCICPSFEELRDWSAMAPTGKLSAVHSLIPHFKSEDERLVENIETIKANLECLL